MPMSTLRISPTLRRGCWPCLVAALVFAALLGRVTAGPPLASPSALTPSASDANPPTIPKADANMEPEEAIRAALAIFARLDGGEFDELPPDLIDYLNRYVVVLQVKASSNPWRAYIAGRTFALLGRGGDAIEQLKRFVETREGRNEWQAYRVLADLLVQEFPRLAKSHYDKAQALKPAEPAVLYGLSFCAFQLGDLAEAARYAQDAVDADQKQDVRFPAHLARILLQTGRREEAERAATRAVDIARQRLRTNPRSGRLLVSLDLQYQLLIEVLRAKLATPAGTAGLCEDSVRLGGIVRERSAIADKLAWHEALRVLEAAVNRAGSQAPISLLERYGEALAEVGRTEEAVGAFEKILESHPENPAAKSWMERLRP